MSGLEIEELVKASLLLLMTITAPVLIASLVVGVAIGLLQALTQVQEMTLTFVPKILAIFAALLLLAPVAAAQLMSFTEQVYAHIETGF